MKISWKKIVLVNSLAMKKKLYTRQAGSRLYRQFPRHLSHATLLKKRLSHRCSSVNFAKFLRTPFLQSTSGRLLLHVKATKNTLIITSIYNILSKDWKECGDRFRNNINTVILYYCSDDDLPW